MKPKILTIKIKMELRNRTSNPKFTTLMLIQLESTVLSATQYRKLIKKLNLMITKVLTTQNIPYEYRILLQPNKKWLKNWFKFLTFFFFGFLSNSAKKKVWKANHKGRLSRQSPANYNQRLILKIPIFYPEFLSVKNSTVWSKIS